MSDLRSFHAATLSQIEKEKADLLAKLQELEEQEATIKGWLGKNGHGHHGPRKVHDDSDVNPLTAFVVRELDRSESVTSDSLRKIAEREGVEFKDGRSFNAVLMNLLQNKRAKRLGPGVWAKTS
jgi:hypothetical protein